jgi:hypothetical protein
VEVERDRERRIPLGDRLDQPGDGRRRRHARRVAERQRIHAQLCVVVDDAHCGLNGHLALERAAERAGDRAPHVHLAPHDGRDFVDVRERLVDRRIEVGAVVRLARRHEAHDLVHTRTERTLGAARVGRQRRDARVLAPREERQHLVRIGKLRHRRGLTNDVASMWRTPAAIRASMTSALTAVSMNRSSDWKPSRVPTSVTRTRGRSRDGVA